MKLGGAAIQRLRAVISWRTRLVGKVLVTVASATLVAYLLGIVGGRDPDVWKYQVGTWCEGAPTPSFAVLIDSNNDRITTRADATNRSNPLDSGDLGPIESAGCGQLEFNAPGDTHGMFVTVGKLIGDNRAYQQEIVPLKTDAVCRFPSPKVDGQNESRVYTKVKRTNPETKGNDSTGCGSFPHADLGPLFAIGGELPGTPAYLDFSRQGAFVTVSLEGNEVPDPGSRAPVQLNSSMVFWLLIPPEHTLLVQRTTPAPLSAIPTNRGTLYKFSVSLLPFPKGGDMGSQFLVGALSFVYESDVRASIRDYLIFVLAAVFAFALERVVDSIGGRAKV